MCLNEPTRESALPADLADWWRSTDDLHEPLASEACGWPGGACRVFRVRTSHGESYLKQHPDHRSYSQELRAYREWSTAFDRTPRLVTHDRALRLLVLSSVEGEPLCDVDASSHDRYEWHREAGRQLAQLHALPYTDVDPLPLREALPRRIEAWRRRGRAVLERGTGEQVAAFVTDRVDLFTGESRVPCHLDYDERNWLVRAPGPGSMPGSMSTAVSVIDFEHARADHRLADFVRLETGVWSEDTMLREAFLDGYGRPITAVDRRRLQALVAMWCMATVVWARERDQAEFEALGLRGLERVLGA